MTVEKLERKNGEHPYGDTGQLILLAIFLAAWAGDSFFLRKTTLLSDYLPLSIRLAILLITFIAVIYLVRSGHSVVSHKQPTTGLVTTGGFKYVRHPLYLGSMLFYFGLAISTASALSLLLLIPIVLFYNYIAGYEEGQLSTRYGQKYIAYMRKTGRWLPRLQKNNRRPGA